MNSDGSNREDLYSRKFLNELERPTISIPYSNHLYEGHEFISGPSNAFEIPFVIPTEIL